jgi:hypothetical protein
LCFRLCVKNILSVNTYTPICAVRYLQRVVEAPQCILALEPEMPQTSFDPLSLMFAWRYAPLSTGTALEVFIFLAVGLNPLLILRRTLHLGTILYRIFTLFDKHFWSLPPATHTRGWTFVRVGYFRVTSEPTGTGNWQFSDEIFIL